MFSTRKLKVAIVSENRNESYEFLKREMYLQYRALNFAYQHLIFERISHEKLKILNDEYQEYVGKYKTKEKEKWEIFQDLKTQTDLLLNEKHQKRIEKAKAEYLKARDRVLNIERKYSKEAFMTFENAVGLVKRTRIRKLIKREFDLHYDTIDKVASKVISDFYIDTNNGVLNGERNYRVYKKTHPLYTQERSMKLYEENDEYYIKWIHGIVFKVILKNGSKQKMNINELKTTLTRIINGEYKKMDSSLEFDKNENLILNLVSNIPKNENHIFIPNRVVGVDLGIKIPAYVSLNDKPFVRKAIGSIDDFLKVRTKLQNQHKKLLREIQIANDGKGSSKNYKAMKRFKEKEKNFVNTYNHFLSKNIINFALKNKAGIIHVEQFHFDKLKHNSLLRNWSYYQLQTMIEYKAEREQIKVYYVDSTNTSQTCSMCGNLEQGQRVTQEKFTCKKCGFSDNADYNASQNISRSIPISKK